MSQVCKLLIWMCSFLVASATAQLISLLPWSFLVIGVTTVVTYTKGKTDNEMLLQVIAVGLTFGWTKCYFLG
ncbi:hypothetical protein LC605_25950 [Nostoc sp. CHAB 5836]|uniref:hypothetical protein n=1 Tax=Nostoc sp. CHAB 5836 TaxID=2780404 RepID=UPI001E2CFA78|nr:hypothetical protein [Nostoc sp. CHAB 5836]MCC5618467.1 hypothetical protein [Nostoc sp. CHAB 5836]